MKSSGKYDILQNMAERDTPTGRAPEEIDRRVEAIWAKHAIAAISGPTGTCPHYGGFLEGHLKFQRIREEGIEFDQWNQDLEKGNNIILERAFGANLSLVLSAFKAAAPRRFKHIMQEA